MTDPQPPRDVMDYDVLIVGAGPAGLACAIRLKQLAQEKKRDLSVCVIEKGSEVGAHLMSGAVFEPRALNELFPNWHEMGAPLTVPAREDRFMFLTATRAWRLPTPTPMKNHGNYIISLGYFARWLAAQAESLGVEIYPGFAAAEVLYNEKGAVAGVATGDSGIGKNGEPTARFTRGVELRARQTVFAEGCRGSLTKKLFERLKLRDGVDPQTYGLGIKEIWEIDPKRHRQGLVMHTVGWPMDFKTYGGSWLYHWENNLLSIGFVVGLDYENPYLSPFEEFQRFKHHPLVKGLLQGGKRISYGARALSEGGLQSIPRLTFPGGLIVGDAAGFLNVPKIKGNHTAMKSGMVAAEALFENFVLPASKSEVGRYATLLKESWLWQELHAVRNLRPAFHHGLLPGLAYGAVDNILLRGRAPWTLRNHPDYTQLKPVQAVNKIVYPKPDGILSFDRLSSVFLSNTNHEEDQPPHLKLRKPELAINVNLALYDSPESRYCPAGVYEIVRDGPEQKPRLQINAQNCVHCKTCDIKDPRQNIDWDVPEGGGGPNYQGM
ncbi:MAG: electron transfer flavoprotein-ubiquinone oxidoreductase [Bdellovibrionales bacterium]